ncbi:MAG: pyridoxamine 5'-phosphate oxidase family protein [Flavobacteriaceae bacterium]|nr:pyridoxamine 5'-phosphate oxidase family protein [Flavobacteriaceae bacterium]
MIRTLNSKENLQLLSTNYIGFLSYIYRNRPFVVPITYFYDKKNNVIISYSGNGHKIRAMRKHDQVSLEVAEIDSVNDWKSILVQGTFRQLQGSEAKAYLHEFSLGVKDLVIKKEGRSLDFISEFSSKIYRDDIPVIYTIKVEEITGRMRKR